VSLVTVTCRVVTYFQGIHIVHIVSTRKEFGELVPLWGVCWTSRWSFSSWWI